MSWFTSLQLSFSIILVSLLSLITASPSDSNTPSSLSKRSAFAYMDTNAFLTAHNQARSKHGVPNLRWSHSLQRIAERSTRNCRMHHTGADNLYMQMGGGQPSAFHMVQGGWYNEISSYNWNAGPGDFQYNGGHFTQVVWRSTSKVGCCLRQCGGNWLLRCKYNAPGNVIGQFDRYHVPYPVDGRVEMFNV